MAICNRCGREFNYMQELKDQKLDIYLKTEERDINGKKIKKWRHMYTCPMCDAEMYGKFIERYAEKL